MRCKHTTVLSMSVWSVLVRNIYLTLTYDRNAFADPIVRSLSNTASLLHPLY